MRGRAACCVRTVVLAGALAGLGACQATGQGPIVTASVTQPASGGMDGDIRRILTQGGLNAAAPGSLQTTKMPADVQQAVAALQGGEAAPTPFGGAAGVAPVGVQSMPQSSASSIAMLPTATGAAPANALALAPTQPGQVPFPTPGGQPPLLAALAQTQAAHARSASRRSVPAPRLAVAPRQAAPHPTLLALVPGPAFAPVAPVAMAPIAPAAPAPAPKPVEPPPPRRF